MKGNILMKTTDIFEFILKSMEDCVDTPSYDEDIPNMYVIRANEDLPYINTPYWKNQFKQIMNNYNMRLGVVRPKNVVGYGKQMVFVYKDIWAFTAIWLGAIELTLAHSQDELTNLVKRYVHGEDKKGRNVPTEEVILEYIWWN